MPWKERTKMDEKLYFIREYETGNFTITELADSFGISRKTAYKYIKRFKEEGLDGLQQRSTIPHTSPNKIPTSIEKQILAIRKKKKRNEYGARKIKRILEWKIPEVSDSDSGEVSDTYFSFLKLGFKLL